MSKRDLHEFNAVPFLMQLLLRVRSQQDLHEYLEQLEHSISVIERPEGRELFTILFRELQSLQQCGQQQIKDRVVFLADRLYDALDRLKICYSTG